MDTEPKTDVPERVINGQNPATSGNSLLGERRKNQHLRKRQYGIVPAKLEYIIDQIESGRMATEIADELGVSPSAITHAIKRHNLTERYRAAVEEGTDIIVQRGIARIREAATDGDVNLARAWEAVQRSTQWYASKITRRFADRQEITHIGVDLASELERAHERLVGSGTTGSNGAVDITPVMHTQPVSSGTDTPGDGR